MGAIVTYADKVPTVNPAVPVTEKWRAVDSNELKQIVNANPFTGRYLACGIIRPQASPLTGWTKLEDGDHATLNIESVDTTADYIRVYLENRLPTEKALTFGAFTDTEIGGLNYTCRYLFGTGPLGQDELRVTPILPGAKQIQARLRANGAGAWSLLGTWSQGVALGATTGVQAIVTHTDAGPSMANVSCAGVPGYGVYQGAISTGQVVVRVFNTATGLDATPPNLFEVIITRLSQTEPGNYVISPESDFFHLVAPEVKNINVIAIADR